MATYSEFLAQTRRELEEPTEGVWADASILWWLNSGIKEIAMRAKPSRDWVYTSTVAGAPNYDLPDGSLEVIEVFCGPSTEAQNKLRRIDFQDFTALPLDSDTGTPMYYAIDDSNIYLYPSPDAVYTLSYLRHSVPSELTAGTDSMPFESRYDAALGYYVKAKAFEQINDWQASDAMLERYEAEAERVRMQEGIEAQVRRANSPLEVW